MSEEAEVLGDADHLTEKQWLQRICRELTTQRKLLSELVRFHRDAEGEVPEYMRRFANYMHDLHDIAYMYEERGLKVPDWLLRDMERCDDRMRQLLKREHTEGTFGKVREEMAKDDDNRWDHKKAIEFRRET